MALTLVLIAIATVRVALTYDVFSHTADEPGHIAAGMEWLDKRSYSLEHQHPPLARVMAALGPYVMGERSGAERGLYREGVRILHERGEYDTILAMARLGILPFLWIGSLVVYGWSRRCFGSAVAVMAVFLFTQLPGILAHSGLATTDMAATAFIGATVYAVLVWLERPTMRHTLVAGGCLGLAVLSKFSSLLLVPGALVAMFGWYVGSERPSARDLLDLVRRRRLFLLPLGLGVAALVIWAGYHFSYGKVHFADARLPAPELYSGVATVLEHNREGHRGYLLGQRSQFGWWYYFPVALALKAPLPFMLLALGGAAAAARGHTPARWPLAYCIGILLCVMPSRINIGTRHVLAIYVGLAILAAVCAVDRLRHWRENRWLAGAVIGMLAWFTASVGSSQPDYLSYFNAMAGRAPERFLVDSDLDWGQDLKRLAKRLQAVGARKVAAMPHGMPEPALMLHLQRLGFPPITDLDPVTPSPGWNAVSLTVLKLWLSDGEPPRVPWPEKIEPQERVGAGFLLYYFPPDGNDPVFQSRP